MEFTDINLFTDSIFFSGVFVFFFFFSRLLLLVKTNQRFSSTHIVIIAIENTTREYAEAVESLLRNDERKSQ